MIDPAQTCFYIPVGLKKFKLNLFERIGQKIVAAGGMVIHGDPNEFYMAEPERIPIVGCSPELRPLIDEWITEGRKWIYWDRGYCRRVFATHLPRGDNGGYYRWHVNSYQMTAISDVPADRWNIMNTQIAPWVKNGKHVVIAAPTPTYIKFHRIEGWLDAAVEAVARATKRQIIVRAKVGERSLQDDLAGAHALVTHGSNAGVEAVMLGCPIFVDQSSAAALVGQTDIKKIEEPVYPDRTPWVKSLAYHQFNERELVDGTLWRLLK